MGSKSQVHSICKTCMCSHFGQQIVFNNFAWCSRFKLFDIFRFSFCRSLVSRGLPIFVVCHAKGSPNQVGKSSACPSVWEAAMMHVFTQFPSSHRWMAGYPARTLLQSQLLMKRTTQQEKHHRTPSPPLPLQESTSFAIVHDTPRLMKLVPQISSQTAPASDGATG